MGWTWIQFGLSVFVEVVMNDCWLPLIGEGSEFDHWCWSNQSPWEQGGHHLLCSRMGGVYLMHLGLEMNSGPSFLKSKGNIYHPLLWPVLEKKLYVFVVIGKTLLYCIWYSAMQCYVISWILEWLGDKVHLNRFKFAWSSLNRTQTLPQRFIQNHVSWFMFG